MNQFNLIDEPWIPVRTPGGARLEMGVREVLTKAKDIAAIEDPSPLVTAALHRFLLAVLYRALEGPADITQARALFKGGLPRGKIEAYLEKWRDRFWLFHEVYPFFQVPDYVPEGKKQWRSWPALAAEHNADNAKVLFDHVDVQNAGAISTANSVRWLLACQSFSIGGGNSDFKYTKGAPSAVSLMVIPLGANLEDSLLFLLVPQNREVLQSDVPVWERKPDKVKYLSEGPSRSPSGLADWYTWRTRSLKFRQEEDGKGISSMTFASGIGCEADSFTDPMLAYRIHPKHGRMSLQFGEKGVWREFDSLLPDKEGLAPQVIQHAAGLTRSDVTRFPNSVLVLGQANNQAKIEFWRLERFALPKALLGDGYVRTEIHSLLDQAETTQKSLYSACRTYAEKLLARGDRKPDAKDISGFVTQLPVISGYWSILESRFHVILEQYTKEADPEDIRRQWFLYVKEALSDSWEKFRAGVSMGDAWAIRAAVKAEGKIYQEIKKLNSEIQKPEPQMEAP
ncbi:CRISPR system Cascade subunit CasA [Desulfatibacillum alkenivorans DSM 16219]|jgi:CRISPR system Cascade subunit CasA|uniref:CRISPR system Cascade subunit CasA n=1 Tax=Desulfatibacillum alkenivorans DSM 16219 TaxID=1121393 RepID=A0A1M6YB72_9BACT|nr:type I-E CRISPR-associated protein Cse1/CasA [Desulfatibacillum alkenivorans]SHL15383.1 CRISPR system Cascade subunit CasA [Desulfatibacillum alkenivorans DSM 16219]